MEFRWVRDHVEVFVGNRFLFSADNMKEAKEELANETPDDSGVV